MVRIDEYHESLKDYFGEDINNPVEIGEHVRRMFGYCDKHQVFWNKSIVRPDCPMCAEPSK